MIAVGHICAICGIYELDDRGECPHCDRACTRRTCDICQRGIEEHRKVKP
jgi:hypothetical protein